MSVLCEITVPAEEFVLEDALTSAPDMRIEIKRVVAGPEDVTPYFWAYGDSVEAFDRALRDDETISNMVILEEQENDERFYRVSWNGAVPNLLSAITDAKATILEAVSGDDHRWELKMLFPDRDALTEFHAYCIDNDLDFELERVYRPENPQETAEYGVTDDQHEALTAAYDAGYFGVPREETLGEVAERLDISTNALSTRLRRGQRNLLSNTIVHDT
ncbi:hypothetical protein SAMN06269185_0624 [Natronoarchaeum philippinense]|uniref:GAF and HTH_10 associated domain-containing protein n=1 Tax=Natronoarchaeum philippinense TaxID=558529 RepID=A0A285N578_NATPI|nr:helix-turn-helix domain-containing protein [Natronoarchaeum philippinense]SNZ04625.1 hypothetical protein SAMN06269185_0624 [Natronoarchaeum philippinense]